MSYIECFVGIQEASDVDRSIDKPKTLMISGILAIHLPDGIKAIPVKVSGYWQHGAVPDFTNDSLFRVQGRFWHKDGSLFIDAQNMSYFSAEIAGAVPDMVVMTHSVFVHGQVEKTTSATEPYKISRVVYYGARNNTVTTTLSLGDRFRMMGREPNLAGKAVSVFGKEYFLTCICCCTDFFCSFVLLVDDRISFSS